MTIDYNAYKNAEYPLTKAKHAWALPNTVPATDKNIWKAIRVNLYNAVILSILTYSLHLFPIRASTLTNLQYFYSVGLGRLYVGSYDARRETMSNLNIRRFGKTPTLKSPPYTRYLRQLSAWKETKSFAYVSNKIELDKEFNKFDSQITL